MSTCARTARPYRARSEAEQAGPDDSLVWSSAQNASPIPIAMLSGAPLIEPACPNSGSR